MWTCAGSAGGVCAAAAGTGGLATAATLPPGATVTYSLTADIAAGASGTVANTATVAAPVGVVDTDATDNSSTDTDTLTPSVDLSITKTDGVAAVVPGTSTTYTITVANSGPSTVLGAAINDVMPAEIVAANWSCTAAGGATCATTNGSGDVSLLASLPAGGSVTIAVVADIDPAATGFVVNSATVAAPVGAIDTNPANDVATDSDALHADRRPGDHQGRRPGVGATRRPDQLHRRRDQPRAVGGRRSRGDRCDACRPVRGGMDLCCRPELGVRGSERSR